MYCEMLQWWQSSKILLRYYDNKAQLLFQFMLKYTHIYNCVIIIYLLSSRQPNMNGLEPDVTIKSSGLLLLRQILL